MTDDLTRQHERALLACAFVGGAHTARNLLDIVQAPMFADTRLARVWSALRRVLVETSDPIDLVDAVATELGTTPTCQLSLTCTTSPAKSPAPPTPPTTLSASSTTTSTAKRPR